MSWNPTEEDLTPVDETTARWSGMNESMQALLAEGIRLKENKSHIRNFCSSHGFDYNKLLAKNLELRHEVIALRTEVAELKSRMC